MKSKRVLFGLIVAALLGGANFASAQTKANYQNNLIEIGPDNVGGRVRTIVVDNADPSQRTLYVGGVAGGLYKKVADSNWRYLPYFDGQREITLPISYLCQLPDGKLLVATGEGFVDNHGVNNDRMTPKGRGLFLYNPADGSFSLVPSTNPANNANWTFINKIALVERNGYYYTYVATNGGLYFFKVSSSNPDWNSANPTLVLEGKFQDVVISSEDNIAYASAPGKVIRLGNVVTTPTSYVDITSSNSAFGDARRVVFSAVTEHAPQMDGSYVHTTFLYAVVTNKNGYLAGVYLSKDQQNWTRLTTSTIAPFTSVNPGDMNSSILVDPQNCRRIYIGGATVWSGEGFVDNSYYQWTKSSYSEEELNNGNYMESVYTNPLFVHSGIHQIAAAKEIADGDTTWILYFATDGGVFKTTLGMERGYNAINKGLNTVQYNHIAVAPDGSVIGGAIDNGCPFIQARNAHEGSVPTNLWYDNDPNSIINHMANVLWTGDGGGVDASMFQQLLPYTRRTLFMSSDPDRFIYTSSLGSSAYAASYGRACADYADYYNTQTWTIGEAFISDLVPSNNKIPQIRLWETNNNTTWNDSITFKLDTLGLFYRNGVADTLHGNTQIQPGDQILVPSPAQFNYPFVYTFTESFTAKNAMTHRVHNPLASRVIVNGLFNDTTGAVYFNATPTYFRHVWNASDASSQDPSTLERLMNWVRIYRADLGNSVGSIAFNRTGDAVYINVFNESKGLNYIIRVYNLNDVDINNHSDVSTKLNFALARPDFTPPRVTLFDTIYAPNGGMFQRPISSISVDQRDGMDNIILTFAGYDTVGAPNLVYVANADNPATRTVAAMNVTNAANGMTATDPVYSAIIEYTTGKIYAGTEKGVFTANSVGSTNWQEYGAFNGVPVTSIVQQTRSLRRQRFDIHDGVKTDTYLFAKTKFPYAIYFGTYGRGVFMDTTYVTDHVAEVCDPEDFSLLGITTVDKGENHAKVYPNPATVNATLELSVANAGNAAIRIYDVNGRLVHSQNLGYVSEGVHNYSLDCQKFSHGIYLVNIHIGGTTATSKLIVR